VHLPHLCTQKAPQGVLAGLRCGGVPRGGLSDGAGGWGNIG